MYVHCPPPPPPPPPLPGTLPLVLIHADFTLGQHMVTLGFVLEGGVTGTGTLSFSVQGEVSLSMPYGLVVVIAVMSCG